MYLLDRIPTELSAIILKLFSFNKSPKSLLNNIPIELSAIINWYAIPIKCGNCKKHSFNGKRCAINSDHVLCSDCVIECNICGIFVNNSRSYSRSMIPAEHHKKIMQTCQNCKYIALYRDREFAANDPTKYYTIGSSCGICYRIICYHCTHIASDCSSGFPMCYYCINSG